MMRFLLFLGIAAAAVLTLIVYACVVAGARSEHELDVYKRQDLKRSLDGHFMALAAEHSRLAGGQAVDVQTFVAGFPAQNT